MPNGHMDQAGTSELESNLAHIQEDEVSLLELLTVIAKRKETIAVTVFAVMAVAAVVSLLIPNRYTANTSLLPPQQPQSLTSALASQFGGGMLGAVAGKDLGLKNPNDVYVAMLNSRVIADALIRKFDLMKVYRVRHLSDARNDLKKATDIKLGKDGLITVSFEDKDRGRAAEVANAYVTELRNLTASLAVTEAGQRRLFFEQQLQKAKDDLADAESALKNTQQKTGLIQLDSQAKAIIESVAALRAQIATKQVQLQAMQSFASDRNPDVILARQQLASLEGELAKLEHRGNAGGGDIQVPTNAVPEAGLEYARRLRDVKYYETIFELLAKQYEAAKLDEAREGAVVQVIDAAVPPDKKSSPSRTMIVLLAGIIGLVASALWALLAEGLARIKQDPETCERLKVLRQLLAPARL